MNEQGPSGSADEPSPRRSVKDAAFLLFPLGQPLEVGCAISGLAASRYEVRLELFDFSGRKMAEHRQAFKKSPGQAPRDGSHPAGPDEYGRMTWRLSNDAPGYFRVRATVISDPSLGPATPLADVPGEDTSSRAELSFAVVEPRQAAAESEFGWSLGPSDLEAGLAPLADLLCQSGIRWVKFPFTIKETATIKETTAGPDRDGSKEIAENLREKDALKDSAADSLEPLISFSDRLGIAGIGLVGVLLPPRATADSARTTCDLLAVEAFSRDPKTWYPSMEPVLARLATQIRTWQIGDDRDPGWVGCGDLEGIVSRAKAELDRIGRDVNVGIAWPPGAPLPNVFGTPSVPIGGTRSVPHTVSTSQRQAPWRFLSLPCGDATDHEATTRCMEGAKAVGVKRWVVLETLPREGHAASDRIVPLVDGMVTAKMRGAEAIFVGDPFDVDHGLVARNGSPSELFLPWRTTALMLGGVPYLGDIDLPQGNQIHCFGGKGGYIGVLAGKKPGQETVYLGPGLRLCDLWGNSRPLPATISPAGEDVGWDKQTDAPVGLRSPTIANSQFTQEPTVDRFATAHHGERPCPTLPLTVGPRSVVPVDELPIFLVGLDGLVTQWQLGVAFSPNRLPSVPAAALPVTLKLKNTFPQPIAGRINIRGPQNWQIEPQTAEFHLDAGAAWQQALSVALPNNVVGGRESVWLDFEIEADRLYRFTMVRPLEVTLADVKFEGQAALNGSGEMEIRQTLTNLGRKPANFRCTLLVPGRLRQASEVQIQPSGKSELVYRLPDGEQLRGKTFWFRAEEIGGSRVLNFRIEATPASAPVEVPKPRLPSRPGSILVL